jgi:hypothetical protein
MDENKWKIEPLKPHKKHSNLDFLSIRLCGHCASQRDDPALRQRKKWYDPIFRMYPKQICPGFKNRNQN